MLRVNSPPALTRDGAEIEIVYAPQTPGESSLELTAGPNVSIDDIHAHVEGSGIALAVTCDHNTRRVELGWLDVAATLRVRVSATVPVRATQSWVRVSGGLESDEVSFALEGVPAFLPVRSRLRFSDASAVPGETLTLHVDTVNDGTATAESPYIYLRIPPLVTLHAGDTAWIEVESDGTRALVLPVAPIEVGGRLQRNIGVQLAALGVDRSILRFEGWLIAGKGRFAFAPAEIEIASPARAAAHVQLVEPRTYRYGERVLAIVGIESTGTDIVRGARVRLAAEGIVWAGLREGEVDFGAVAPFARAARLVEGEVVATPSGARRVLLHAFAAADAGTLCDASTSIDLCGTPRVDASLVVEGADGNRAHLVRLRLVNRGDGTAQSVGVMAELPAGVVGVVDSLKVDGAERYALDGSVPVLCGDEFGPLGVATEREITWRVRSDSARDHTAVTVTLEVDGHERHITVFADFVEGNRVAALPTVSSETAPQPVEDNLAELDALEEQPVEMPVVESSPQPRVRYDVGPDAVAGWRAWFPDGYARAELGRYVIAARLFIPTGSSIPAADAALAGVRAEAGTVAAARLEAFEATGVFGASGFDFSTTLLRKSIRSYYAAMDEEAGDLDGIGLDRALVRTIGAAGTPYAQAVETLRGALLDTLESSRGTVTYGEDAPRDVVYAAGELFALFAPLEVA